MIEIRTNIPEIIERLKVSKEKLRPALLVAARKSSLVILGNIRKQLAGKTHIPNLIQSFVAMEPDERPGSIVAGAWTGHVMARLREYGHPGITPGKNPAKSGPRIGQPTRALAIPVGVGKTLVARVSRGGPVTYGDRLKWRPNRSRSPENAGVLMLDGKVVFALKRIVRVPAKPYAKPALEESVDRIREILREALTKTVEARR